MIAMLLLDREEWDILDKSETLNQLAMSIS